MICLVIPTLSLLLFIQSLYSLSKFIYLSFVLFLLLLVMKGTKVLTLGAGREVLPHNVAVTKDADDIYTRPLAIRMRGTVNWWAGWSNF